MPALRFDHSRAISQDLPAVDLDGHETGDVIPGLGTMYTWNVVSPRLGVDREAQRGRPDDLARQLRTIQPGRPDGRTRSDPPRCEPDHDEGFDPATGGYTRLISVVDPKHQPAARSATCARRTRTSTRSASIARSGAGWRCDRLHPQGRQRTSSDGRTSAGNIARRRGRCPTASVPVYMLVNSTADRRFLLTNPDEYSLTYNGLVIVVEKRRSHGWQAFGSYTYSQGVRTAAVQRHDRRRPRRSARWRPTGASWP